MNLQKMLQETIEEANASLAQELFMVSYAPFTEYGKSPVTATVIDSDAVVIDDEVRALLAPKEK